MCLCFAMTNKELLTFSNVVQNFVFSIQVGKVINDLFAILVAIPPVQLCNNFAEPAICFQPLQSLLHALITRLSKSQQPLITSEPSRFVCKILTLTTRASLLRLQERFRQLTVRLACIQLNCLQ